MKTRGFHSIFRISLFITLFLNLFSFNSPAQVHIAFTENKGQWNDKVLYKADLYSGALFLEKGCFTYNFVDHDDVAHCHTVEGYTSPFNKVIHYHAYKVHFLNSSEDVRMSGAEKYPHYNNYFLGNDRTKWASRCTNYRSVTYQNLYDNVNLKIYENKQFIKYDLIINPGGELENIVFEYEGVDKLSVEDGNLFVLTSVNEMIEQKPYAYQVVNGREKEIKCQYILRDNKLSFEVGKYDDTKPLIIDPELIFASYIGSIPDNFGYTATYDSKGFLYSGCSVFGNDYPVTTGAYQITWAGGDGTGSIPGTDIGITKWDTTGTFLIYSTYIGGSHDDLPHSIIVNDYDELYLLGTTSSGDFPTTINAYDTSYGGGTYVSMAGIAVVYVNGSDIVLVKLNTDGTDLMASTFLGGSANDGLNTGTLDGYNDSTSLCYNYADEVRGEILIDKNNDIYVASCTQSADFPVSSGVLQQTFAGGLGDACIVKMDADLSSIIWSTFLGGTGNDAAYSIAIDNNNDIYVAGGTVSTNFPVTSGAYNETYNGDYADGFVTHIDQNGQNILHSSFFGSDRYDQAYFVEIDNTGNIFILGQTEAQDSVLIYNVSYSVPNSGQFIAKFTPDLNTLLLSSVFGKGFGRPVLSPLAFLVDVCDKIYVAGWGGGTNNYSPHPNRYIDGFYVTPDAFQPTTDGSDHYIIVFEMDMDSVFYATFMGGDQAQEHVDGGTSRFSRDGKIYGCACAG